MADRLVRVAVAAPLVAVMALVGCSRGDGRDIDARPTAATPAPGEPTAPTVEPTGVDEAGAGATTSLELPAEPTDGFAATSVTLPPPVEVPETGIPGLGSTDQVCAALSRFAGSFQMVSVNYQFAEGWGIDPVWVEVIAAGTVVAAHAELAEVWPDELADEAEAALDDWLGPLTLRLSEAEIALAAHGATDAQLSAIADAWATALAERDPMVADVIVDLDPELMALVDVAAADHEAAVMPWFDDASLRTGVAVPPLTERYVFDNCPDAASLFGVEVG